MAGLLDRIKALPSNPLAMASLGLLSMPTHSRYGVNPMEYAMNGMQMGLKNQQAQQQMEADKQAQLMREQEYKLRVRKHQDALAQTLMNRAKENAQREYQQQYLAQQSPENQMLARAYPEIFAAQQKEAMKPKGFESGPGKRAQDLMTINPSLSPQAAYDQAQREIMSEKKAGAASVNIPGELGQVQAWKDAKLITPEQAQAMILGEVGKQSDTPQASSARAEESKRALADQMKAQQQSIAQQNLALLEQEIARAGMGSVLPDTAAKIEGYRTAAAIALARAQSPKPDQEPNDVIVESFKSMLPGATKGATGMTGGLDAAYDLVGGRKKKAASGGPDIDALLKKYSQ